VIAAFLGCLRMILNSDAPLVPQPVAKGVGLRHQLSLQCPLCLRQGLGASTSLPGEAAIPTPSATRDVACRPGVSINKRKHCQCARGRATGRWRMIGCSERAHAQYKQQRSTSEPFAYLTHLRLADENTAHISDLLSSEESATCKAARAKDGQRVPREPAARTLGNRTFVGRQNGVRHGHNTSHS